MRDRPTGARRGCCRRPDGRGPCRRGGGAGGGRAAEDPCAGHVLDLEGAEQFKVEAARRRRSRRGRHRVRAHGRAVPLLDREPGHLGARRRPARRRRAPGRALRPAGARGLHDGARRPDGRPTRRRPVPPSSRRSMPTTPSLPATPWAAWHCSRWPSPAPTSSPNGSGPSSWPGTASFGVAAGPLSAPLRFVAGNGRVERLVAGRLGPALSRGAVGRQPRQAHLVATRDAFLSLPGDVRRQFLTRLAGHGPPGRAGRRHRPHHRRRRPPRPAHPAPAGSGPGRRRPRRPPRRGARRRPHAPLRGTGPAGRDHRLRRY